MLSLVRFERFGLLRTHSNKRIPVITSFPFLFFEDERLDVFRGPDEQLATTTAGALFLIPGRRERKDLSPQTSEKTRLILFLCLANHDIHFLFNFIHEVVSALVFRKLNAESRKGNLLGRPVYAKK
jgi:hypothetical protein